MGVKITDEILNRAIRIYWEEGNVPVPAGILAALEAVAPMIADAAAKEEREACAKLAVSFFVGNPRDGRSLRTPNSHEIAAAIRARSNPHD